MATSLTEQALPPYFRTFATVLLFYQSPRVAETIKLMKQMEGNKTNNKVQKKRRKQKK